jgi:hypothetical protein
MENVYPNADEEAQFPPQDFDQTPEKTEELWQKIFNDEMPVTEITLGCILQNVTVRIGYNQDDPRYHFGRIRPLHGEYKKLVDLVILAREKCKDPLEHWIYRGFVSALAGYASNWLDYFRATTGVMTLSDIELRRLQLPVNALAAEEPPVVPAVFTQK